MRTRLTVMAITFGAILVQEVAARWHYRRTAPPDRTLHEDERTAWTPLWRELLAPLEWLAASVRSARDLPRGDGAPVVLVHGFLMRGVYLAPLRRRLRALGYEARVAAIGWNADCFHALTDRLIADLERTSRTGGRPAHLVGHSLGGILAHGAAVRAPHLVASVTMLGSPLRGLRLHPALRAAAAATRAGIRLARGASVPPECATLACPCTTVQAVAAALPAAIPLATIATRNDGVADWRYAIQRAPAHDTTVVRSSHMGLVFSRAVLDALAQRLASLTRATPARATGTGAWPPPRR
jgi:pimeloyl-ACP methyl ester carboxylesterase